MALRDSPFMPAYGTPTSIRNDPKVIRRYQTFHKLPVTGQLDARTATHMRKRNTRVVLPARKRAKAKPAMSLPGTRWIDTTIS